MPYLPMRCIKIKRSLVRRERDLKSQRLISGVLYY
jgi:hypothetical protein